MYAHARTHVRHTPDEKVDLAEQVQDRDQIVVDTESADHAVHKF